MAVTQSVAFAAVAGFATNWGPSGTPESFGAVSVPAGSIIAVICGADDATQVTAVTITDAGSHTWTRATPTYGASMAATVDYWYNNTGSTVSINASAALTYANNKSVGLMVLLIAGSSGVPHLVATLTNASTASALGTPTVIGSLFILHVITQTPTAAIGTLATGSAIDSTATDNNGFSGANAFQIAAVHQTATNSQTSTPVTVGGSTPTSAGAYGVLLEYVPPGGSTVNATAVLTGTSGLTVAAILTEAGAAILPAASTFNASAFLKETVAIAIAATSGFAAAMVANEPAALTMAATSALTAAVFIASPVAAVMPAQSGLTVAAGGTAAAAITISASSTLAVTATQTFAAAAVLAGQSGFTSVPGPITIVLTAAGVSGFTATATLAVVAAATLAGQSDLIVAAGAQTGTAEMDAVSGFAATAIVGVAATATMAAQSGLFVTAAVAATVTLDAHSSLVATAAAIAQAAVVAAAGSNFTAAPTIAGMAVFAAAATSAFTATASGGAQNPNTPYVPGPVVHPADDGTTPPRNSGVTHPRVIYT